MNKNIVVGLVAVVIMGGLGFYAANRRIPPKFDPGNATYVVDGQSVTLRNNKASVAAAPGSASKIETIIFGKPVMGDLNGDRKPDAVLMLKQTGGGSGTFYYVAVAINENNHAKGTNAVLLGDRIAPQTLESMNGRITVNYADRMPGEPMTTPPSLGVSKYLMVQNGTLVESQ